MRKTQQGPPRPPAVADEIVDTPHLIEGIPLILQAPGSMLCGYCCIRMLQKAAGVKKDPGFEARRRRYKWKKGGLPFCSIRTGLRNIPGWREFEEVGGGTLKVWNRVAEAALAGQPSVLWIPRMDFFPDGHYVVVAGAGRSASDLGEHVLWLMDPFYGGRWMSRAEWASPAHEAGSRVRRAFVAPAGWRAGHPG